MTHIRRAVGVVRAAVPDLLTVSGIASITYGLTLDPLPPFTAPVFLGVALLAVVRFGGR